VRKRGGEKATIKKTGGVLTPGTQKAGGGRRRGVRGGINQEGENSKTKRSVVNGQSKWTRVETNRQGGKKKKTQDLWRGGGTTAGQEQKIEESNSPEVGPKKTAAPKEELKRLKGLKKKKTLERI